MKTSNASSCKTAAVMGLLSRGPSAPAPAEGGVPAAQERTIEQITADIQQAQVDGVRAVLAIGNGLIEAKGKLNHGEWLDWLKENIGYSEKNAENYMRIARNYSNPQLVADLGIRKALCLLALPETDRETFVAEANVVDMTSRELEKAVRDREQALADKAAAEAARAKMAEDMTMVKGLLETAQEERDKALEEVDARQSALRAAEERTAQLSGELEALKNRPVEVAVQVDQEAVDRARAEGEAAKSAEVAALQEKLNKEKEKTKKLKADLDTAAQGRAHAESALGAAQAKLAAAAQAEKPSPAPRTWGSSPRPRLR